MAYIIDLTSILQDLFQMKALYLAPVSNRLIKFASEGYKELDAWRSSVSKSRNMWKRQTLSIERVAMAQLVKSLLAEMFKLKDGIGMFDISGKGDEL
jgi:hypothetical protein